MTEKNSKDLTKESTKKPALSEKKEKEKNNKKKKLSSALRANLLRRKQSE